MIKRSDFQKEVRAYEVSPTGVRLWEGTRIIQLSPYEAAICEGICLCDFGA
jgi:hypothetical protein